MFPATRLVSTRLPLSEIRTTQSLPPASGVVLSWSEKISGRPPLGISAAANGMVQRREPRKVLTSVSAPSWATFTAPAPSSSCGRPAASISARTARSPIRTLFCGVPAMATEWLVTVTGVSPVPPELSRASIPARVSCWVAQMARAASPLFSPVWMASVPGEASSTPSVSAGASSDISSSRLSAVSVMALPELAASVGQICPVLVTPRPAMPSTRRSPLRSAAVSSMRT